MAIEWTKEQMKYFISEYKKLNTPLVWDALFVQYGYRNQILRREVKPILRDMSWLDLLSPLKELRMLLLLRKNLIIKGLVRWEECGFALDRL